MAVPLCRALLWVQVAIVREQYFQRLHPTVAEPARQIDVRRRCLCATTARLCPERLTVALCVSPCVFVARVQYAGLVAESADVVDTAHAKRPHQPAVSCTPYLRRGCTFWRSRHPDRSSWSHGVPMSRCMSLSHVLCL